MSVYATAADLTRLAIPAEALEGITVEDQDAALSAASSVADGYLASRYTLPLTSWGDDLRRAVCLIAAYDLMTRRGYNPEGGDEQLRLRYEDAIRWLERVADGKVTPPAEDSSTAGTSASAGLGSPEVRSGTKRGW